MLGDELDIISSRVVSSQVEFELNLTSAVHVH